jgi:prevent-host-death family protein
MTVATIVSKTDLARRTRQIVNQARRGGAVIVESYGEEQVAILDAADYRCLRAMAAYYAPRGLDADEVQRAVAAAEGDAQTAWNRVLKAYLDGDISLGRAAELLELSRFDLLERMNRLGLPLHMGPSDLTDAQREVTALR